MFALWPWGLCLFCLICPGVSFLPRFCSIHYDMSLWWHWDLLEGSSILLPFCMPSCDPECMLIFLAKSVSSLQSRTMSRFAPRCISSKQLSAWHIIAKWCPVCEQMDKSGNFWETAMDTLVSHESEYLPLFLFVQGFSYEEQSGR